MERIKYLYVVTIQLTEANVTYEATAEIYPTEAKAKERAKEIIKLNKENEELFQNYSKRKSYYEEENPSYDISHRYREVLATEDNSNKLEVNVYKSEFHN